MKWKTWGTTDRRERECWMKREMENWQAEMVGGREGSKDRGDERRKRKMMWRAAC